jgi:hypothetical protein
MAKFLLGEPEITEFSINKKSIQWMVDFTLPDEVRDTMPCDEVVLIDGIYCMDFYSDPHVGDFIKHRGFRWQILSREFLVTRHLKRQPKAVPMLVVEYVGKV